MSIRATSIFITVPQVSEEEDWPVYLRELCSNVRRALLAEFCVMAVEKHEDEGHHLHGVIRLGSCRTVKHSLLDELFGKHGHYEVCRRVQDTLRYTCKDGIYYNDGCSDLSRVLSQKSKKVENVGDSVVEFIKEGKTIENLMEEYGSFVVHHYKNITALIDRVQQKTVLEAESKNRIVIVICGKPGTGKTKCVRHLLAPDELYVVPVPTSKHNLWFDGYNDQRVVLFDDFVGQAPLASLLRLTHEYSELVEVKGSHRAFFPDVMIFTTNIEPHKWYNWENREEQLPALMRRITLFIWFGKGSPGQVAGAKCGVNWVQSFDGIKDPTFMFSRLVAEPNKLKRRKRCVEYIEEVESNKK